MIASGVVVYVSCQPVDFRKGAASLMALVRDAGLDPFNGALYVFRSHRLVGRLRGLPVCENPGRAKLLLAGHIGGADPSGPRPIDGPSGRFGLEENPPGEGETATFDRLKPACDKLNHVAVNVGKSPAFMLYCFS